jgi:hypothetical protein
MTKESSALINSKETSDEIINTWQGETRSYKIVNPELPHCPGQEFVTKGENIVFCNEHLTGGTLACKVQDLRDA